jgi:hypothetical protein
VPWDGQSGWLFVPVYTLSICFSVLVLKMLWVQAKLT